MQLFQKLKPFSLFFFFFDILEFILNFERSEKKITLIAYVFWNLQTVTDVVGQVSNKSGFRKP